ncbi:HAMP domain-containing sensor histidine kinase [Pseudomonas sp. BBP2017]|uniref:sensor histidine kinase n=1 Tax=Pseudomonas sp. BBP2017 TaxID=2109731 RepID=UPI000D11EC88|nr:HAMP domain-containing sensor histidine kinase [Pseudomonas sp. BBP2017]PSS58877.1 two-component sensor histidine kinase [Pseudomonas sp. BBP2017]
MNRTAYFCLLRKWLARPHGSLVARYTLLSVFVMSIALIMLAVLYEQLAKDLLNRLTGERLDAQALSTANRLSSFLDDRFYQVSALSNHPNMPGFIADQSAPGSDVESLLKIEADFPFLYGVLFFDEQDHLVNVLPGQAASGEPYWTSTHWSIAGLPIQWVGDIEVIGPLLAEPGRSGGFLIRKTIRNGRTDHRVRIALHLRLASLTELLVSAGMSGVVAPLLRVPGGAFIDPTGRAVEAPSQWRDGPQIIPGWQLVFRVQPGAILKPLNDARWWLYWIAAGFIVFILIVFFTLSRQLRSRVSTLLQGAHQLSMGDLSYRLAEQPREDEINHVARAFNVMAARLADMLENTVRTENLAVLGAFATGVAHEVRNPLTTMKTTVQALLRREEEPERRHLLTDLGKEIDRLSHVTSDLLEYGRPHPAQPEVVAVAPLFEQIVRMAGPDDPQLLCETEPGLQLYVDPDQVRQILVNLCLNAFQACDNQSPVRLCAKVWGGQVRVMVIDQGCGISEADLQRIRQPFFTSKARGTGLGLSISQQLLEANGARMDIISTLGVGTQVILDFPAPPGSEAK